MCNIQNKSTANKLNENYLICVHRAFNPDYGNTGNGQFILPIFISFILIVCCSISSSISGDVSFEY